MVNAYICLFAMKFEGQTEAQGKYFKKRVHSRQWTILQPVHCCKQPSRWSTLKPPKVQVFLTAFYILKLIVFWLKVCSWATCQEHPFLNMPGSLQVYLLGNSLVLSTIFIYTTLYQFFYTEINQSENSCG